MQTEAFDRMIRRVVESGFDWRPGFHAARGRNWSRILRSAEVMGGVAP